MTMLDAHVHVWDPRRLRYPWLDGLPPLQRPFLPDEIGALQDAEAIFVEAGCASEQSLDEVRWVDGLDWPGLVGIVAAADLRSDTLPRRLDELEAIDRFAGVRHLLQDEDAGRLADPALRRGLRAVAERGLTFDACIRHEQLPGLRELLESAPGVRVVLDHLGKPPVDDGLDSAAGQAWARGVERIAQLPEAHVKLSGLAPEARTRAGYEANADAFLAHALSVFGPKRSMLASDWPVSALLGAAEPPSEWSERVRRATALDEAGWTRVSETTGALFYGVVPAV